MKDLTRFPSKKVATISAPTIVYKSTASPHPPQVLNIIDLKIFTNLIDEKWWLTIVFNFLFSKYE